MSNHSRLEGSSWLLAEDDFLNQELVAGILEAHGVTLHIVEDGQACLDALQSTPVAGVLMDCQMPVLDGFGATEKIRQNRDWANLPILAFTGSDRQEELDRIFACGMNAVIAKPLKPDQMLETMSHWLERASTGDSLTTGEVSDNASTEEAPTNGAATDEEWAAEPLFDPDAITALVGDRVKSQVKFLARFLDTSNADRHALVTAIEANNPAEARSIAHRLKSSSASIGARQFSVLCRAIEHTMAGGSVSPGTAEFFREKIDACFPATLEAVRDDMERRKKLLDELG